MNTKTLPIDYANGIIYELEKAFWDERGKGARFRVTTVGQDYFEKKCLPLLKGDELSSILGTIEKILTEEGIVAKVSYSTEDRLIRIRFEGCIHRSVEAQMVAKGVEPFTCVPANLIVLALEKKLDRPVEIASIKYEEGACQILMVLFDKHPVVE